MIKKTLLAALLAAGLGGVAAPAAAAVDVYIDLAPPPARYEVVPAATPRLYLDAWLLELERTPSRLDHGHLGARTPGLRLQQCRLGGARRPLAYAAPRLARHDRDGDGVPDRYDSHPNNPRRD